ncbi:S-layer homology domain-containing protein [Paenibacillus glycinis]|uniref:SLH domain-containing protein n=1 Tax=Paenibacillus glycinis TaxID=2697035 RepID=A0ABW9XV30_9BACL|nr:S-layer homology domain-containing protein [Paenibacillus glycinis]NBD26186.1 hypothetical protein [Paenibacillus glycinis]
MKRKAVLLAALAMALAAPAAIPSAAYAAETAITAEPGTAINAVADVQAGGTVTISGTTNASEVIIKVIQPDGTILFFDTVKASGGLFTDAFKLPSTASTGTYQIVAGQGTDVDNRTFTVTGSTYYPPPVNPGNPVTPTDPAVVQIKFGLSDVSSPANGFATVDASKSTAAAMQILIPAAVGKSIGDNGLRIVLPGGAVALPKEVLKALAELGGTDADASIALNVRALSAAETASAISGAAGEGLTPQGQVYEISLSVILTNGSAKKLDAFAKPVQLQLKLSTGADARLAGIYYVSDSGTIEYVGATVKDGAVTADITHFSAYGVFAYSKTYTDVPSSYWAAGVIRELTAKHIVEGISDDRFGPKANITRAEFVAMLVRALGLKATAAAPFTDIPAGSWFAETTAAAYENGIASGTGNGKFEPNKAITREEMAIMIVNVYAKRGGAGPVGTAADLGSFKDAAAVSSWAKEAVQTAIHAGLMTGSDSRFAPREKAIRAEAAKVLYNLLFGA